MNRNVPIPLNDAISNKDNSDTQQKNGQGNGSPFSGEHQYNTKSRHNNQVVEYSSMSKSKRQGPLPVDYIPSPNTVVIGRGKFCTDAAGSKRLRNIAVTFLNEYSKANTKAEKSSIVSIIVDIVEEGCPYGGAFVKFIEGRWWEVDSLTAREKVGYVLRDLLHDQYRSSSKSKAANRRRKSVKSHSDTQKGHYTDESCSQSSVDSSFAAPSFSNEELQRLKCSDSSDELQESNSTNRMAVEFGEGSHEIGPSSLSLSSESVKTASISSPSYAMANLTIQNEPTLSGGGSQINRQAVAQNAFVNSNSMPLPSGASARMSWAPALDSSNMMGSPPNKPVYQPHLGLYDAGQEVVSPTAMEYNSHSLSLPSIPFHTQNQNRTAPTPLQYNHLTRASILSPSGGVIEDTFQSGNPSETFDQLRDAIADTDGIFEGDTDPLEESELSNIFD